MSNKLLVDAKDILAKSYMMLDKAQEAMVAIKRAIHLSPMSLERQFTRMWHSPGKRRL
jgi:hypothetical protein